MASTGEAEQVDAVGTSLGDRFETEPNALNFLRLVLALEVIVWHAYALRGSAWLPEPVESFLANVAVDSFFAISGFLIVRAWQRDPHAGRFFVARAARVVPGLWGCLLVTAFVVAPLVSVVTLESQWGYVLSYADTWGMQKHISGGPTGVVAEGIWNGSLWSLRFETGCYLVVIAIGAFGLVRARAAVALAFCCWLTSAVFAVAGVGAVSLPALSGRTGLMFAMGALAWFHRDRVPVSGRMAGGAVLVVLVGVVTLPDYRLLAAPAVAYLAVAGGTMLGKFPRLVIRNDLSYGVYIYGFVMQQALLASGAVMGWAGFALLSGLVVVPVAAASWFLIERPALTLARRAIGHETRNQSRRTLLDPLPKVRPAPTYAGVNAPGVAATSATSEASRRSAPQMAE